MLKTRKTSEIGINRIEIMPAIPVSRGFIVAPKTIANMNDRNTYRDNEER
tara:strand:+ start:80 stop:229 length:150 start_codon:yes stop_codon:yes gene_type:complete